ncbi:MAG TPA: chemotaxis protein CheA [Ohtaekwangia sp.]|uniref:chemotaxis protein CheA n=1 Tax=Ohtaekwangia sp. TaxID=2066019 RepID=UPI002F9544F3
MTEKLLDIFLGEAQELIVEIEKAVLLLEQNQQDEHGISAIFRAMHTLKGSSGMFGFEAVSGITHHLESIYQDIRDGARAMDANVLAITLKTLDHLRNLMQDPHLGDAGVRANHEQLLTAILSLEDAHTSHHTANNTAPASANTAQQRSYYIYILPHPAILRNGTNILYLVDDLLALGEGTALPFFHQIPELAAIAPDTSYMGFEVVLATTKKEEDIQEVFMFVESDCDITIKSLADGNILSAIGKHEQIQNRDVAAALGYEGIKALAAHPKKKISKADKARSAGINNAASIRVSSERLDDLMNLVSELVTTQARLSLFSGENDSTELSNISENIEKITRRLRDNAFTMSLVPLESIVVRFQRLVSDLSKELHKDIEFTAVGMDTKIDKSIIEKLTDPLLHILRNSIDHGIENPEERKRRNKSPKGKLQLRSYYSGGNVIIEIADDGAGIDLTKVKEKAIAKGLIDGHAALSEKELTDLIFLPGFSTASVITGVSGRGVGMDVVRRNVSDIRGEIDIATRAGEGTTFIIKLPLTLSILDGLLVKIGDTDFILPLTSVAKCYEVKTAALESSFNQLIQLDEKRLPFFFLRNDFAITDHKPELSQVILVSYDGQQVGLVFDRIEGEYQAVLKPLGEFYQRQNEFSGATILGNGNVALVLDPNKLIGKLIDHYKNQQRYEYAG